MNTKTAARRQAIAEFRRQWRERYGKTISDSEARACFRGECSSDQYRMAFQIAREYGIDR